MSLVSLGACMFTLCSVFAFESGPMGWDASRVSAAIPSGVGFLGAGISPSPYISICLSICLSVSASASVSVSPLPRVHTRF